ncbi:MAG: helix-turn-helix domain-containing protein [Peptococcaceae bacterium]|jgi:transcriptional regulator with XRE-family HTH domain|nr:helix-turn-helix domain-containing protein [Peptococcaceae bacterium]MDR2736972.1 helix-turn-helix domain-containing protein [Gracilibacteraceae bacterium]
MIDAHELENTLSKRIVQLRVARGVSARDMSLSIGQGPAYINNIENRRTMPSMRGFFYICEYLKISPQDFFDFDSTDHAKLNDIIQDLKELPPEQLAHIAGIVKGLRR